MGFFKRLFGSAVEQTQEFDVAMASCQFESDNKDCSLVQQLKDRQTRKRAIDNKIRSYDDRSVNNITNFFLLLVKMEEKGIQMDKYDGDYPFRTSKRSSINECFERRCGMARLEDAIDELPENCVALIGSELNAIKTRAKILGELRSQSAELEKEILAIKAQLGIE